MNDATEWLIAADRAATLRGPGAPPLVEMTKLTSYAEVEEAFNSKDFVQAGGGNRDGAPMSIYSLVSLSGDEHFERRRMLAPLFRMQALVSFERDAVVSATNEGLRELAGHTSDGVVRGELLELGRSIFVRMTCTMVGIDGLTSSKISRLCAYQEKFADATDVEWSLRDRADILREALEAKREFVAEFFAPSWARREALVARWRSGSLDESQLPNDLITLMIRNKDRYAKWDQDVFVREARVFMTAGSKTPAMFLAHAVVDLSAWLKAQPDDARKVRDDEFVRAALNESLRLHVGGSPKVRRALRDTTLASGRPVRAGEHFFLDSRTASRDRSVFGADAEMFDPHRTVQGARPYGFGFGGGPHTCIGKGLAVGEERRREDAPIGVVVHVLSQLFAAGIALDPDDPPRKRTDTTADEYERVPVRFDRLEVK